MFLQRSRKGSVAKVDGLKDSCAIAFGHLRVLTAQG